MKKVCKLLRLNGKSCKNVCNYSEKLLPKISCTEFWNQKVPSLTRISRAKCLNDRFKTPLGPFTVIVLDLTDTVKSFGIFTV